MYFRKRFPLMDEVAVDGGQSGGSGGFDENAEHENEHVAELALNSTKSDPAAEAAAAQAAAVADALNKEADGWVDPSKGSVAFDATGDAGLDVALAFVAKAGFTHHHPAVQAAAKGDFSLLSAALAAKGVPGWEQHVALAKDGYARAQTEVKAHNEAIKTVCLAVAGDQATWDATLAWGSANADAEEKGPINAALAQGGIVGEAMAAYLVQQYKASNSTRSPTRSAVNPSKAASVVGGAGSGPLSPADYSKAVAALRGTGKQVDGSPEYKALQQRRSQYRG